MSGGGDQRIYGLTRDINRALRIGDNRQATRLMDEQLSEVMGRLVVGEFSQQQGDPLLWHPSMEDSHERVAMKSMAIQFARRATMTADILSSNNWQEVSMYGDSIVQRFKERNKTPLLKEHPGMSMEERVALSQQLVPVELDPNEVATYRQRLVQIDQQLKTVGSSVYTDPRTARIAKIISTEAEPASPGYAISGEQDIVGHMPLHERLLMPVRQGTEAFVGAAAQVGVGVAKTLESLGVLSLDAMSGGQAAAHYNGPTAWVQDSDGSWYHNGGKVGAAEMYAGVWHMLTGQLIDQEMADYGHTAAIAAMNQSGVRGLTTGVAHFLGSMTAFIGSGGPAMKLGGMVGKGLGMTMAGGKAAQTLAKAEHARKVVANVAGTKSAQMVATQLTAKGLGWVVTGGKAPASIARAKAIVKSLQVFGAAAGLGAYEAVNNGHIEGYGAAFTHGAIMAAPMMLIGQLGRSTERLLKRTTKMPARLAATMAGAVEGTAFAALDWKPIWNFIQDPNTDTRDELAKHVLVNLLGMAALKGAGAPTPGELALPDKGLLDRHAGAQAEARSKAGRQPSQAAAAIAEMRETESQVRLQQTKLDEPAHVREVAEFETRQRLREAELLPEHERAVEHEEILTQGPFKKIREEARQEREERVRGQKEPRSIPSSETIRAVEARGKERMAASQEAVKEPRAELEAKGQEALDRYLKEGPDPLDSKIFRKLPEGLQLDLARTSDPMARRRMMLEYKTGSEKLSDFNVMHWQHHEARRKERLMRDAEREESASQRELTESEIEALRPDATPPPAGVFEMAEQPGPKFPGQPASQRMTPQLEMKGVPGTPKTRKRDVHLELEGYEGDPVRMAARVGNVNPPRRLPKKGLRAWFDANQDLTRMKEDWKTAELTHEWAHNMMNVADQSTIPFLEDTFFEAARKWYPNFTKLDKPTQFAEAWAEFWARHMLGDPTLREETGMAHDALMKWMSEPGQTAIRNQMQRSMKVIANERDQGARARGQASIMFHDDLKSEQELKSQGIFKPIHKIRKFVKDTWRQLNKHFQDDTFMMKSRISDWMKQAYKDKAQDVLDETDILSHPTRLLDTYRMTANKVTERFILKNTTELDGTVTGEGLVQILNDVPKGQVRPFFEYVNALRSLEANKKGEFTHLHPKDAQAIVDELHTPEMLVLSKRLRGWSRRIIDYGTEGGLWSEVRGEEMKSSWEAYIPFYRMLTNTAPMIGRGRGYSERGTGVKPLGSSQAEIADPVDSLGNMARNIITKTHQNMVMKAQIKFMLEHRGIGGLIHEVDRDTIPHDHPLREMIEKLTTLQSKEGPGDTQEGWDAAIDMLQKLANTGEFGESILMFSKAAFPHGSKPIIAFTPHWTPEELADFKDPAIIQKAQEMSGKIRWYEVDPEVFNTMMGVDQPFNIIDKLPPFIRSLVKVKTELVRAGATVLSPAFVARNMVRNVWQMYMYSPEPMPFGVFSAIGKVISSSVEVIRGSPDYEQFENLGGSGSTYFSGEVAAGRTARELIGRRGAIAGIRHAYATLANILGKGEGVPRFRSFKFAKGEALGEGKRDLSAALEGVEAAKEISDNFTRAGVTARALNQISPYLTAQIAGTSHFLKAVTGAQGKEVRNRVMVRGLMGMGMAGMVFWWLNKDKKWHKELSDYDRMNNLFVDLDFAGGGIVKVPIPFELGKVFTKIPEMVLEQAYQTDPVEAQMFMSDIMLSMLPQNFSLNWLDPMIQGAWNINTFTGKPIVPESMKDRLPKDQFTAYTRGYAKMIGRVLDISPMIVERQVESATGGLVGRTWDFGSLMTSLAGMSESKFRAQDVPFVGTLVHDPFRQPRSVEKLFELDRAVSQRLGSKEPLPGDRVLQRGLERTKADISDLMKRAREGTMPRAEANQRASELAGQFLSRNNQR